MDAHGYPRSWAHYVWGLGHLGRAYSRTSLQIGRAARMSAVAKEDYEAWEREHVRLS